MAKLQSTCGSYTQFKEQAKNALLPSFYVAVCARFRQFKKQKKKKNKGLQEHEAYVTWCSCPRFRTPNNIRVASAQHLTKEVDEQEEADSEEEEIDVSEADDDASKSDNVAPPSTRPRIRVANGASDSDGSVGCATANTSTDDSDTDGEDDVDDDLEPHQYNAILRKDHDIVRLYAECLMARPNYDGEKVAAIIDAEAEPQLWVVATIVRECPRQPFSYATLYDILDMNNKPHTVRSTLMVLLETQYIIPDSDVLVGTTVMRRGKLWNIDDDACRVTLEGEEQETEFARNVPRIRDLGRYSIYIGPRHPDESEQEHREREQLKQEEHEQEQQEPAAVGDDAKQQYGSTFQQAMRLRDEAVRAKDEAVRAKDEAVRAKDEAVRAKDEAVRAKDEAVRAKGEAVRAKDEMAQEQRANDKLATLQSGQKRQRTADVVETETLVDNEVRQCIDEAVEALDTEVPTDLAKWRDEATDMEKRQAWGVLHVTVTPHADRTRETELLNTARTGCKDWVSIIERVILRLNTHNDWCSTVKVDSCFTKKEKQKRDGLKKRLQRLSTRQREVMTNLGKLLARLRSGHEQSGDKQSGEQCDDEQTVVSV